MLVNRSAQLSIWDVTLRTHFASWISWSPFTQIGSRTLLFAYGKTMILGNLTPNNLLFVFFSDFVSPLVCHLRNPFKKTPNLVNLLPQKAHHVPSLLTSHRWWQPWGSVQRQRDSSLAPLRRAEKKKLHDLWWVPGYKACNMLQHCST